MRTVPLAAPHDSETPSARFKALALFPLPREAERIRHWQSMSQLVVGKGTEVGATLARQLAWWRRPAWRGNSEALCGRSHVTGGQRIFGLCRFQRRPLCPLHILLLEVHFVSSIRCHLNFQTSINDCLLSS